MPTPFDPTAPAASRLLTNARSRWKMSLFFLQKLPTLFWWSVRLEELSPERCRIAIPFRWRTQNPFRSIYFSALAGAAELSTGMLASLAIAGRGQVSMLVTRVEAEFVKKATSRVTFTCEDGAAIIAAADQAIVHDQPTTVKVLAVGTMADGREVARFWLTWSFRRKA